MRLPLLIAASLLSLAAPAALAQGGPPTFTFTATAVPPQPGAIDLPVGALPKGRAEQWFMHNSMFTVRNVVQPTLTPFLPVGASTGAAVIIAPGGGFTNLSMESEGWKVARWLANQGIAAFVLKYRVIATPADIGTYNSEFNRMIRGETVSFATPADTPPEALADGMAALRHVRTHAAQYGIDPARVGFMGFSAGGMLTRSIVTHAGTEMPAFVAPIYPTMHGMTVPDNAPPMFVTIATDDFLLLRSPRFELIESWRAAQKPVEFHLLSNGGHGFGFGRPGTASEGWLETYYAWLKRSGMLEAKR